MPKIDSFDPAHPVPRFLADQAERDIGNDRDEAIAAPRGSRAGMLMATAAATLIALIAIGNPAELFAVLSASLVDTAPSPTTSTIQSAADAPALVASAADAQAVPLPLPPATTDAPARGAIAVSEPAGKEQIEQSEVPSEALFRQFQVWAAEQDAQAPAGTQAAQNVPAPAAQNVRGSYRPVQKRRQVRAVQNARAEVRKQTLRRQVPQAQSESARRPVQDARAQEQSGQNGQAQAPSFLSTFGSRN